MAVDGAFSQTLRASENQQNIAAAGDGLQFIVCHSCRRSVNKDELENDSHKKPDTASYVCSVCEEQAAAAAVHENATREGIGNHDNVQTSSHLSGNANKKLQVVSQNASQLHQLSAIPAGKSAQALFAARENLDAAKAAAKSATEAAAAAKAIAIAKAAVSAKAAAVAKAKLEAAALAARAAAQIQLHLQRKGSDSERGDRKTSSVLDSMFVEAERVKMEPEAVEDKPFAGKQLQTGIQRK